MSHHGNVLDPILAPIELFDEFGMDGGKTHRFRMDVTLRIQVEAIKTK